MFDAVFCRTEIQEGCGILYYIEIQTCTKRNIVNIFFSILGVNFFGGKFGRCVALKTSEILPAYDPSVGNATSWEERCDVNNTHFIEYLKGFPLDQSLLPVLPEIYNKTECNLCREKCVQ